MINFIQKYFSDKQGAPGYVTPIVLHDGKRVKRWAQLWHIKHDDQNNDGLTLNLIKWDKPEVVKSWEDEAEVRRKEISLGENEVILFDYLSLNYRSIGVRDEGKTFIIKGVDDINKIILANDAESAVKIKLAQKVISQMDNKCIVEILNNPGFASQIFGNLPRLRIDLLNNLKNDLASLLDKTERDVQNWIDAEPRSRCLIFGLEFIDYKREVTFGNSRFDLLTEQSGTDHVVIEMKSPNVEVFDIKNKQLKNGVKEEYALSADLAEAIPQVINYFDEYKREDDVTFKKNGVVKRHISKGIIVIGRNKKDDLVWQKHFCNLRHRISGIEIMTYDHLIEKMENQINNLKTLSDQI